MELRPAFEKLCSYIDEGECPKICISVNQTAKHFPVFVQPAATLQLATGPNRQVNPV